MFVGEIVLLVFGVFILVGGFMGYRAGSKASLVAGSISGVLLLVALGLTHHGLRLGLWFGALIGFLLCVSTGMRLAKTGKFMPSGMLLTVSVIATAILGYLAQAAG